MFKKKVLAVLLSVVMMATMLVALPIKALAFPGMLFIDYEDEFIGGLDASTEYLIYDDHGDTWTIESDAFGRIEIDEAWFGNIIIIDDGTDDDDIAIGARQVLTYDKDDVSVSGANDGSIKLYGALSTTGVNGYEYKAAASATWTDVTGDEITSLAPGTYQVRIKPLMGTEFFIGFASTIVEVTILEGPPLICEIEETGVQFTSIEAALPVVTSGQTIILITDVKLTDDLYFDNGVTFTFDTNEFELDFDEFGLEVSDGSKVNFVGCDMFKNLGWIDVTDTGTQAEFDSSLVLFEYLWVGYTAVAIVNGSLKTFGNHGVFAQYGATVTIDGDIDTEGFDGVHAESGAKVTVTGDITALKDDGVSAYGADTEVIVIGSIDARYGIYAGNGAKVTVTGGITAGYHGILVSTGGAEVTVNSNIVVSESDGVRASAGAVVTVNGNITTLGNSAAGVYAQVGAMVTVNGNIDAVAVGIVAFDGGTEVVVNGNIVSGNTGVYADTEDGSLSVIVSSNITAAFVGVDAWGTVVVFVGGDIVVTDEVDEDDDWYNCGVFVAFGAEVTVDGTITAPNYVGFLIPFAGEYEPRFYYLEIDENTSPSGLTGYFQYDDEGKYDMFGSYVWVKDPRTLTPGTGDSATLWLLLGALMVAALGTGLVLAHRRREQEV